MKGKIGFVVLIAAAVISLGFFFSSRSQAPTVQPAGQSSNEATTPPTVGNGRYVEYTKNSFEAAKDKKRILYFHANWCPTCRPLDREFQTMMDKIPSDVVVFKTNYDTETSLKQKYAITYQHTFIQVDALGNEIAKWSGGNLNDVLAKIQ